MDNPGGVFTLCPDCLGSPKSKTWCKCLYTTSVLWSMIPGKMKGGEMQVSHECGESKHSILSQAHLIAWFSRVKEAVWLLYFRMAHMEQEREPIDQLSKTLHICSQSFNSPTFPGCSCRNTEWAPTTDVTPWGRRHEGYSKGRRQVPVELCLWGSITRRLPQNQRPSPWDKCHWEAMQWCVRISWYARSLQMTSFVTFLS